MNTPITAAQVKQGREALALKDKDGKIVAPHRGLIYLHVDPNRKQRKAEALERSREARNITLLNNRNNCGRIVLQKMGYFYFTIQQKIAAANQRRLAA